MSETTPTARIWCVGIALIFVPVAMGYYLLAPNKLPFGYYEVTEGAASYDLMSVRKPQKFLVKRGDNPDVDTLCDLEWKQDPGRLCGVILKADAPASTGVIGKKIP